MRTSPSPSDTYVRLLTHALSFELGDPQGAEAMAVLMDCAMSEGLALDLGGVQAYDGARPSPLIHVTAVDMVEMGRPVAGNE